MRTKSKRKNPDLHTFISKSLDNIQKTRAKLNEAENYLRYILTTTDFTDQDLRNLNDIEYRNENPIYELYQEYRNVLAYSNNAVEQTKYIIEITGNYKKGKPKKRFTKSYWA